MADATFPDIPRIDARDKVRGVPIFAADLVRPELAHAALVPATIAKGRVASIDTAAARAAPGVLLTLTHEDLAGLEPVGFIMAGGHAVQSVQPMLSPAVAYRGQPVALVAAETLEAAAEAAALVRATYTEEPFSPTIDSPGVETLVQAETPLAAFVHEAVAGDAEAAYGAAPVRIDAVFNCPPQHQNPIEMISTVAEWQGDRLVVREGTQNAEAVRHGLAMALTIPAERIDVISPYAGGGFGQKNSLQMQTVLAAVAARRLGRPVKLVVPRAQLFHDASFRPATRHRVRLGADLSGKLVAGLHDIDAQTSRHDLFPAEHGACSARLHGFGSFRSAARLVRTDTQTPGYMRAPFEHSACFAMECAIDELACRLGQDPVALRLANDAAADPVTGLPFSSRHAAECLRRGAERFGWSARTMAPGSMRAEDGSAVGWGVALGCYPGLLTPAVARIAAFDDGRVLLAVTGHEMGQGLRTALAAAVGRKLGVPADRIDIVVGDTRAAPQHVTAGSWGAASAVPAAEAAAAALAAELAKLAPGRAGPPAEILAAAGRTSLEARAQTMPPGQPDAAFDRMRTGHPVIAGPELESAVTFSFVAHFAEVRIEPGTRRIRVPRIVSVVDCGRVVSPRTAASQVRGGVVWGVGGALREESEVDPRYGGFLNADLADYVVPVNADIGDIDVGFIDEPDPVFNSAGIKGLGEVALTGVAPAIANAVFHATGRRVRKLPIRIEDVM